MESFEKKMMKKIPGYCGYYAYKNGRIYSRQKGESEYRQLAEYRLPYSRYLSVYLYRNKIKEGIQVHKLIASAYRKINYRKYNIFHKDKNYLNNIPYNLIARKKGNWDRKELRCYATEISDMEAILKSYLNYDYKNPIWNEYKLIRTKRSDRMVFNWLKVLLLSKKLI